MKRAIEEDFPIVEINRLAVPERNSFKPIYQMHKWFARRASCVFRAILLGALKPAGTNIMEEFYKDHTHDLDTCGKIVLDPFMGGGTTVVEALRLGCKVVGIDLNPVAWLIVKTEVEPVTLADLDAAFERLTERIVTWSGQPLRETLLSLYKTAPPWTAAEVCGLPESDIIYTFWVKSAVCTNPSCRRQVPLFSNYVIAAKSPSIRYFPDCTCPKCRRNFDWEIEPAALVADPRLMFHSTTFSGGISRSNMRWTYAHPAGGLYIAQGDGQAGQSAAKWGTLLPSEVCCPHCYQIVKSPVAVNPGKAQKKRKAARKKVPLTVLLCPSSEEVFQWRGELPDGTAVTSPAGHVFDPQTAHVPEKGRFVCSHCGNNDSIIASIRSLPEEEMLPVHAYGLQAYARCCDLTNDPSQRAAAQVQLFAEDESEREDDEDGGTGTSAVFYDGPFVPPTHNLVWKQSGKYYARHAPADESLCQLAEKLWQEHRASLPHPKSEIPPGQETDRLHEHHYRFWHQMFTARQLLALSTLLDAIRCEPEINLQNELLGAMISTLEGNNLFCRYRSKCGMRSPFGGIFSRHDFQPKVTTCENNVWGAIANYGPYISNFGKVRLGKAFALAPYDFGQVGGLQNGFRDPVGNGAGWELRCGDSREELFEQPAQADLVITDPPYAGNVNYSELADFFYVWLRLVLRDRYPQFLPEHCPKVQEIIENKARGLDNQSFRDGLTVVLRRASESTNDGTVIFTYHHNGDKQWNDLLQAICDSGLQIEAIYPVHSESENSMHLQNNEAISYDLIHVCRRRRSGNATTKRSWAGLRQAVRQRAREEIVRIEAGRYGGQPLLPADVRMVLIGKSLEVYSRHYGAVMDWDGKALPLRAALQDIRMMVEQIVTREEPLPVELETVDALSQVWLLALCDKREVSVDNISKLTRGVFEVSDLTGHKPPILRKGRVKGGRTYEVLTPLERLNGLRDALKETGPSAEQMTLLEIESAGKVVAGPNLVDVLHLLLANAEQGERLDHLVERFNGQRDPIRAALEYLKQRNPNRWAKAGDKLLPFYSDLLAQAFTVSGGKKDGRLPRAS